MKVYKINEPVWNGGKPFVTVGEYHLRGQDSICVQVMWTDKQGNRKWPDDIIISKEDFFKLEPYPVRDIAGRRIWLNA